MAIAHIVIGTLDYERFRSQTYMHSVLFEGTSGGPVALLSHLNDFFIVAMANLYPLDI